MTNPSTSPIVLLICRWLSQLIQIFAIYVITHGHYSPGGGFQGGALLAASILLLRLSEGDRRSQYEFSTNLGIPLAAAGTLVFLGTGLIAVALGGQFMDYGVLTFLGSEPASVRYMGILIIEIAVGLAVMAGLIAMFDDLMLKR